MNRSRLWVPGRGYLPPVMGGAEWPDYAGATHEDAGADTANSRGTLITASATINTKGTYAQLIASTARACQMVVVQVGGVSTFSTECLVDIALGAAASEVDLIGNIPAADVNGASAGTYCALFLPVSIRAGTRISARMQSNTASVTVPVKLNLMAFPFPPGGSGYAVETLGALTSTSRGTTIDPGATANTKGAWAQLIASTARAIRWLGVIMNTTTAGAGDSGWLIDVGIGAAASEVVIIPNLYGVGSSGSRGMKSTTLGAYPVDIPAGTRVAVRAQSNDTAGTNIFDCVAFGVG